jgi:hypothetical protein
MMMLVPALLLDISLLVCCLKRRKAPATEFVDSMTAVSRCDGDSPQAAFPVKEPPRGGATEKPRTAGAFSVTDVIQAEVNDRVRALKTFTMGKTPLYEPGDIGKVVRVDEQMVTVFWERSQKESTMYRSRFSIDAFERVNTLGFS